jgi:hypothetical protein
VGSARGARGVPGWGGQYWDGAQSLGRAFRERIVPGFAGEVAWDVWVLFDGQATWESAGQHVLG